MTIEELIKEINAGKPTLGMHFDIRPDKMDQIALKLLSEMYKELGSKFTHGDANYVITCMNFWNFCINLMRMEMLERRGSEHKPGTDSQDDTGA